VAQVPDNTIPNTSIPKNQEPKNVQNQNTLVHYENTKYGFALELPKEWAGYRAVYEEGNNILCMDATYSCVAEVQLLVPTNDPHYFYNPGTGESNKVDGYGRVLMITVVDSKQWDKSFFSPQCKKDPLSNIYCPQRMLPSMIGKNDQYVFFIYGGINSGGDPHSWPNELKSSEDMMGFFQKNFSVISVQK
jgi:hypothetical protein